MSFSYALFLALLLLAPGFAVWAGLRAGERSELISQSPEKPGSTFSLLVVVFGAIAGHILLSGLYAVQASFCRASDACLTLSFDPNIYRVLLSGGRSAGAATDWAFFCWLASLLLPSLIAGVLTYYGSRLPRVRDMREAATFGWLKRWVDLARPADSFMLAYVVTTLEHDGAHVAYEGIVENIALDDNRAIAMLVLSQCDRFMVRVQKHRLERIETGLRTIPLIQLEAAHILNVALEVFGDPGVAVEPGESG